MSDDLPRILFVNINGSGLGHLSRCLAYARRLQGRAKPVFFSMASAIEIIETMGFEADYFVSEFWSSSPMEAWNRELAVRMGLLIEELQPHAVLFDGTWPFHGFMDACDVAGVPVRIWSNRGLHKDSFEPVPVAEIAFDLVLLPGEVGTQYSVEQADTPGRKIIIPPVALLDRDELLDRKQARSALGLSNDRKYALLSLGPGNLKDISEIGEGLIADLKAQGFNIVWARAPISTRDIALPRDVIALSEFPLVKYMRAFDVFAGAAGYNTCCEVLQSGIPSLLVPNKLVADDQVRRAQQLSGYMPVVVSECETYEQRKYALQELSGLAMADTGSGPAMDGADLAADEILSMIAAKA